MTTAELADVFVHPQALCESRTVGRGSRIWAFAHVLPGAQIGSECNICDGVFIENDVLVGDRVTVKCGVQLWDGLRIEDDVFIGPNATFTNDPFPRSKVYPTKFGVTIVRKGASIGANATILPGLEIGQGAMVAAGAVVTSSVPANAIVTGNPARIAGYVDTVDATAQMAHAGPAMPRETQPNAELGVGGAMLHQLRAFEDLRGKLSVAEFEREIPFVPRRFFVMHGVPSKEVRGQHALRNCHQFLVCITGSVRVMLDDGNKRCKVALDRCDIGLYVPPMVWKTHYAFADDTALMVFASHAYDAADYIRSYDEYLDATSGQHSAP